MKYTKVECPFCKQKFTEVGFFKGHVGRCTKEQLNFDNRPLEDYITIYRETYSKFVEETVKLHNLYVKMNNKVYVGVMEKMHSQITKSIILLRQLRTENKVIREHYRHKLMARREALKEIKKEIENG